MATTSADRQKAYRKRAERNNLRRLNLWIDSSAALALGRLARHEGATQRQILERLVVAADEAVTRAIELDTPEWAEYFAVTR